jgi:5-methylcytosine-specific restriction enzyme subunit McrC
MAPKQPLLDRAACLPVELSEWQQVGPEENEQLRGISFAHDPIAQGLVRQLGDRIRIHEGYHGIEISSTSFVGRIDVGSLRIEIRPKLPAMPLAQLLRYAYRLRDIATFHESEAPLKSKAFHDLLIDLLMAEVEELIHRGLARRYVPLVETLQSLRGRVLPGEIARRGGIREARLPCLQFDRYLNWHLNRVLYAGLEMAASMTEDRDLRRRALRIANSLDGVERKTRLDRNDIDRAERELTRMTVSYLPALTVIRMLHAMLGVSFGAANDHARVPGFLFDMNLFFERLLSRFLHENLDDRVLDQFPIREVFAFAPNGNPKRRLAPTLRPDFVVCRAGNLSGFVDSKYRDVWTLGLPSGWLYQLSIYSMAAPNRTSIVLYATTNLDACDERIEVRQPVHRSQSQPAVVIVRPVLLQRLAELVDPHSARKLTTERRRFAHELVAC